MLHRFARCLFAASMAFATRSQAQSPPERERVFCRAVTCPGSETVCLEDTLEVTFDGETASVFEYGAFQRDAPIDTVIVTDTRTPAVQGWSFAVEHDEAFLTLLGVSVDGTEAERAKSGGFVVADMVDIDACSSGDQPRHRCNDRGPGTGYIVAVILHLTEHAELPIQRNKICKAAYALEADAGANGSLIQIVHKRLKKRGSPPVDINITAGGQSRQFERIIDGWVKSAGEGLLEACGNQVDDDGDGKIDCEDRDCFAWLECTSEICDNQRDDDENGRVDCEDPGCFGPPFCDCPPLEVCNNGLDDDLDGVADCGDRDCQSFPGCGPPPPPTAEVCDNGLDDDRDRLVDCQDRDCANAPNCPRPEACRNFRDDDLDGLVDCDDADCRHAEDCMPGPERRRVFCDPADPANSCPGADCKCAPDPMFVTFEDDGDSVFQYVDFEADSLVETAIATDTQSERVQDWSFAVEHDPAFLSLISVTIDGTAGERAKSGGFIVVDMRDLEACRPDDPGCKNPVPGTGYVCVVMLSLGPVFLPPNANTICKATYALQADPGQDGTLIRIVDDRLKKKGSPPVNVRFTIDGRTRAPTHILDGWVKAAPDPVPEVCGNRIDDDRDGLADCADPDCRAPGKDGDCTDLPPEGLPGRPGAQQSFLRGDADGSGKINVVDAIAILRVVFAEASPKFQCGDVLDVTDDGRADVGDSMYLLQFVFARGPGLPEPFPACGADPTAETGAPCLESNCLDG